MVELRARASGHAHAATADIEGRRVMRISAGGPERAGAITSADGATLAAGAATARRERLPIIMTIASSGSDLTEGVAALDGWGRAARELSQCSGVVPIVAITAGPAVSGPALLVGLADIVIMTAEAYAFVSGPHMVERFTGVPIAADKLGGAATHASTSGVADFVVDDVDAALAAAGEILSLLPSHADERPPGFPSDDPVDRDVEAGAVIPDTSTGAYDVRVIVRDVVDDDWLLELHERWAPNLVTGFATLGGRPVGVVANQPQSLAGTLDITASKKGARFVAFCDAFNLPIITFVDTSGFYPGKDLEWRGMIRYGAQMAFAYARATVPRVNITIRKSYGGAYIVMDSKDMGNDVALAWPTAEIAVMGAKGAVEILHRKATAEERAALESSYEERLLNPYIAAERGAIDAVIDPADTRREIHAALTMLDSKRERLPRRRHDNGPL